MENQELKNLETRIDELIRLCTHLDDEIKSLRANERLLREERSKLLRKNEDARFKVESMITRLKALEHD